MYTRASVRSDGACQLQYHRESGWETGGQAKIRVQKSKRGFLQPMTGGKLPEGVSWGLIERSSVMSPKPVAGEMDDCCINFSCEPWFCFSGHAMQCNAFTNRYESLERAPADV